MKRLVALLLALILVLGLCACASDTTDDQKTEAPTDAVTEAPKSVDNTDNTDNTNTNEKNYTIGFFVKDNTNPFWRYIVNGAMKAGEDLGVTVIEYTPAEAQNVEQQVSLVQDAIQAGVDGMCVVAIDSDSLLDSCQQAIDAGIVVVPFNSRMDSLNLPTFVGIDNAAAAATLMEEVCKRLDYKGKIVLLEGHLGGYVNNERMKGWMSVLEKYPDIEVVADQSGDGQRELSMTVMENILQSCDEIDAVVCHNDNMAMGAFQAILAAGRQDEMFVTGFDAQVEALESMIEDDPPRIAITIDQTPFNQGYYAVKACVDLLNGLPVEKEIPTGGTLVTPENAQQVLDDFYS